MRIISGKHSGRKITAPKKLPVRPTTDMAKEGLFNVLNNTYYFEDSKVLDLFSGTGNMAYEFGSRGSTAITCVDENQGCISFISKTANLLGLAITPLKSDVFSYLQKTNQSFDIIFADPPYNIAPSDFYKIPELIFENNLLANSGVLVVEHSKHTDLSKQPYFTKMKKYGSSVFSFFQAIPQS